METPLVLDRTDGTCGYFNDVPYFSPVETKVFYDAVSGCRLHKLPSHLMVKPRSRDFFMEPQCSLAHLLEEAKNQKSVFNTNRKPQLELPDFRTDFAGSQSICGTSGKDFITIRDTCVSPFGPQGDAMATVCYVDSFTINSINKIWLNLVESILGRKDVHSKFVVLYLDRLISPSEGEGSFLFSLLMTGVASILHYYAGQDFWRSRMEDVSIEFQVLNSEVGSSIGDMVQCYIQHHLKLSVLRVSDNSLHEEYEKSVASAQLTNVDTMNDWFEILCTDVVDAHEELCDEKCDSTGKQFCSPVILVIVPPITALRAALEARILDSYSSEPLRVHSDLQFSVDEFNQRTPLVFLCSSDWISKQSRRSKEDRLITKMSIQIVIHGGFCELESSFEEEFVRCCIVFRCCLVEVDKLRVLRHSTQSYFHNHISTVEENYNVACESSNVILLIFRRFLTRYSPASTQPYLKVPREIFLFEASWRHYYKTLDFLRLSGAVTTESESNHDTLELSVLGRFLSYRFRVRETERPLDFLSITDGKAILWSFLLRQPLHVPLEIVKKSHTSGDWVEEALKCFCEIFNLSFESNATVSRRTLVRQLALFGLHSTQESSRIQYLLSSPFGSRCTLQSHSLGRTPTVCRGWYEQAPLKAGLALEKKEVNTYCLPPKALFCELEAVEKLPQLRIQCPLEVSYPVLIAHSILHISLHNLCVFNESDDMHAVSALPVSLLESTIMRSLFDDHVKGNAGLWLDGILSEITLTASDPSILGPLPLRGRAHIAYCERELFSRKRKRNETPAKISSGEGVFDGVTPRTATERSAIEELTELIKKIGREKAEKLFRGKKGFNFLEPSHELHSFYLSILKRETA